MAHRSSLNLRRWRDRLGWKREDLPPHLYAVQLVELVADSRSLTPHLISPTSLIGGEQAGVALEHSAFEFHCSSEGGAIVTGLTGASDFGIRFRAERNVFSGATVALEPQVSQVGVQTTGRRGTMTAAEALLFNTGNIPVTAGLSPQPINLYVPPGFFLIAMRVDAAQPLICYATFEEPPADTGN